jgi:hypothetical protein
MPHIVIGDPSQRVAHVGPGNQLLEDYLGVLLHDAPDEWRPGQSVSGTLILMYWPGQRYDSVIPGATFTLREGPNIVGFGRILPSNVE